MAMLVRMEDLSEFLTDWYGPPVREAVPVTLAPVRVPDALASWHAVTSRWSQRAIVSLNHFVDLRDLTIDAGGMEIFWYESQGSWEWGADPNLGDPLVYGRQPGESFWCSTGQSMSEFLRFATLLEAVEGSRLQGYASNLSDSELDRICAPLQRVDVSGPQGYMPSTRFFSGEMLLARTSLEVASRSRVSPSASIRSNALIVAALNREALDRFVNTATEAAWRIFDSAGDERPTPPLPF
jgi:hypothetical protein